MPKLLFRMILILSLAGGITSCALPLTFNSPTATAHPKVDWEGILERFTSILPTGEPPYNLEAEPPLRMETDFDVDQYFVVLDHLSMEEGYVLDYDYSFNGFGGNPTLYARPISTTTDKIYDYLAHVRVDGTLEGFYQYVILAVMGDKFYVWWHALNDHDVRIVVSKTVLEKILTERSFRNDCVELSAKTVRKARALDLEPKVEINGSQVVVKVVVFTINGGFLRWTYRLNKDFPHFVQSNPQVETLAEHHGGCVY